MHFNYCCWSNNLIALVGDAPSEEDLDKSEGASANPEENLDLAQPGPSDPPPSKAESSNSSIPDDNSIPRTPGWGLGDFFTTPERAITRVTGHPLLLTPANNFPPLPVLLGDLFTPQRVFITPEAAPYQEITIWDGETVKTVPIPRRRGDMITGMDGEPNTIRVQLTTDVPEQMEFF
jgi:hypothetical protein